MTKGKIRVGKCIYKPGGYSHPVFAGFAPCPVLTKSSKYGSLGPYLLKNDKGEIMENIWQFSKVYETVPDSCQRYSRYDQTIIWHHSSEKHAVVTDEEVTMEPAYFTWREKGFKCKYPVRYPVGYHGRHKCIFALANKNDGTVDLTPLDYIESRKGIYVPIYTELVKKEQQFKQLQRRLENGENLLIIDIDGPHQESLEYYKKKYNVRNDFIVNDTILITEENLNIMVNDEKHPFGHGYCLAAALLGQKIC